MSNGPASSSPSFYHSPTQIHPPKIVITDMDEDPDVKRAERMSEILDWSGKNLLFDSLNC